MQKSNLILLTGSSNQKLAADIGLKLNLDVFYPIDRFADGEIRISIPRNIRRNDVFIIQPTAPDVNSSIMELLLMIDAAKRSSASEITAIIPYFSYSRQDRKDRPRVPISSSLLAQIIRTAGADRIVTVDIHSEQQQGFFSGPWDNLYGSYSLVPTLRKMKIKDLVIASPDKGGVSKATAYARFLNAEGIAIVFKERDVTVVNKSETLDMIGDVKGKNVLIVDDIIDTAGTLANATKLLLDRGAKTVRAAATHGLFSEPALERIEKSGILEVFVTDTVVASKEVLKHPKIKIISVAKLVAEAIRRIETGESISEGLIL
ncbi:MAG: ribose-phosphate pyrophosphokinase [Candidatus Daviesbacteria bacterium]|nr:ribose-phosphate pyrophosphokinase [Candidatus Daviesbacteria bacterium]